MQQFKLLNMAECSIVCQTKVSPEIISVLRLFEQNEKDEGILQKVPLERWKAETKFVGSNIVHVLGSEA